MINLHVEPKQPPISWDEFIKTKPKFSIALDGYVNTGPRFLKSGPYLNANHHENVDRLATRCTCAQILMCIRQGLFSTFKKDSEAHAEIFVNDCDEDVCTSWFLLNNHYLVLNAINPMINKLVHLEDMMDSCAGSFPFPQDLPVLKKLAWVFYPYRSFRLNGNLTKKDESDYKEIISDVETRIMTFINGNAKEIHLDTRYEILGGTADWKLIKEIGAQSKMGMVSDGIKAYVSVRPHEDNKTFTYTVGKVSPFINFDIIELLNEFNKIEFGNELENIKDLWGGGDMIGGSPRTKGSQLKPNQIEEITNEFIKRNQ